MHTLRFIVAYCIVFAAPLFGQQWQSDSLRRSDLAPITGSWVGTEYNTATHSTQPLNVDIEQSLRTPRFVLRYSTTPNRLPLRRDTLLLAADGRKIGAANIIHVRGNDATTEVQTEEEIITGRDTTYVLRLYTIAPDSFSIQQRHRSTKSSAWQPHSTLTFTKRIRVLTPEQMKHDLSIVRAVWESIHPGLYRYNTKSDIARLFAGIERATNAPLEQRRFYVLLQQLSCALRCGHSFVSYYNTRTVTKANLYSRVVLPFLFRTVGRSLVITHPLSEDSRIMAGSEILALNGIPVRTVIDSLLTVSKSDGRNGLNKQLDNITLIPDNIVLSRYSLFDIYFPLFFKEDINAPDYTITLKNPHGKTYTFRCAGISKQERYTRYVERFGALPRNEETWYLRELTPTTILFRLGDFSTYNWKFNFRQYLDSVFRTIGAKGYRNLVVDIRSNEGGADEARDAVLSYLTSKDIACVNPIRQLYRYRTIPDSLLPYLDTWDDDFKKPKTEADYVTTPDGFIELRNPSESCSPIASQPNHFKGKIVLLTDVTNSSATFIMADAFRTNKLGTIIGETTGGSQQGINGGELFFLYLPNSLMEMDVPLIYQCPRSPRPDEGIKPDIAVPTTLQDIILRRDPQIERALRELR